MSLTDADIKEITTLLTRRYLKLLSVAEVAGAETLAGRSLMIQADEIRRGVDAIDALVVERNNLESEVDHWGRLAFDDPGKNPPELWKDIAAHQATDVDRLTKDKTALMGAVKSLNDIAAFETERHKEAMDPLRSVLACLLDHYLLAYGGNADALALLAMDLVPNWTTLAESFDPAVALKEHETEN